MRKRKAAQPHRPTRKKVKMAESRSHSRPPMERMMRIHQEIASGGHPNATTLANALDVCTKSVVRDVAFMRDRLKLPIQYDDHKYGYYYTQPVSSFPTLQITEGELVALFVAEKALQQYRGTTFEKPLITAFEKLASQMQDTVSFNIGGWDQTISFRTSAEPIVNLEIFDKLAKATSRQRQIEFVYRKPGQDKGDLRVADPYHLSNINGEWFLFAFDHGRKDLRTFVPIRMSELRETGNTFTRPEKFSVQTRLSDSFGVISGKDVQEVVVRFSKASADYIREKRWHPSQVIKELSDGQLELRMKISSLAEVQRWILSWGGHATAMAPDELRDMVLSAAQAIVKSTATAPRRGK